MGNRLSQTEETAIEVIVRVLNRATPKQIAEHPLCGTFANKDLLLKALELPRQSKRQPRQQTSPCKPGEDLRALLAGKGVEEPRITTSVKRLLRAIQDIGDVARDQSYNSKRLQWNDDAQKIWRSDADELFVGDNQRGLDCFHSLYDGLVQVQRDDYVSSVRRRFILLMLTRLRYRAVTYAALFGKPRSRQPNVTWALNWIAPAIGSSEEDLETKRKRLGRYLRIGNKYLEIRKLLGMGFLFLLGGVDSRTCWEIEITSDELEVLSHHLRVHFPHIVKKAEALSQLTLNVFEAGLRKCGWMAWEERQVAEISVLRSSTGCGHLTSIEHFLGGNVSVGNITGDSHKKRRREKKDSPQKRRRNLPYSGESDGVQATLSFEARSSPRSHSTSEDTGLGERTIPSRRASNSSPPNNLVIDIPSSQSHTTASRTTLQSGDTESQNSCRAPGAGPPDMFVHSDIVAANQSLCMSTVTSPPKSTSGNSEDLQSADSRPEVVFGQATGFMDDFAFGREIEFGQATGFMDDFAFGREIEFGQATGYLDDFASGREIEFGQATGYLDDFASGREIEFGQADGFSEEYTPGGFGSLGYQHLQDIS